MNINNSNSLYIFYIIVLAFTTNHIGINESYQIFSDQVTYLKIIESAPFLPSDRLDSYQAQRFFFPFIIGSLINFLDLCL